MKPRATRARTQHSALQIDMGHGLEIGRQVDGIFVVGDDILKRV